MMQSAAPNVEDPLLAELLGNEMEFEELIPVDKFFDSYVNALQNPDVRPEFQAFADGSTPMISSTNSAATQHGYTMTVQQIDQSFESRSAGLNGYPDLSTTSSEQQLNGHIFPQNTAAGLSSALGVLPEFAGPDQVLLPPSAVAPIPGAGRQDFRAGGASAASGSNIQEGAHGHGKGGGHSWTPSSESAPSASNVTNASESHGQSQVKPKRIRNKNARQQMLNKAAQQRYRERKKQKARSLEETVKALTLEVEQLQAVQKEKNSLADRAQDLERQLLEKEAELQRVREEQRSRAEKRQSEQVMADRETTPGLDVMKEAEALSSDFHLKVGELRTFMEQLGIDNPETTNAIDIAPDVSQELSRQLEGVMQLCMKGLRLMPEVDVWSMIEAKLSDRSTLDSQADVKREKWLRLIRSLGFSQEQKKQLLGMRQRHLGKLDGIFVQRQALHLEAIGLMTQNAALSTPTHDSTRGLMGRISRLPMFSFFQRNKQTSALNLVLGKLKGNLREEQKANAELDYIVMNRICRPPQSAWLVLGCFPEHCDSLTIVNACYESFGEQDV